MPGFALDVQLNVDASAGEPAAIAYEWLEHMASALAGEAMKELVDPAPGASATGEMKLTRWHDMRMETPRHKLRASGAFAEVRPLAAGGGWLRATEDFADYNLATAEPVFRTLAPILPPGKPMPAPDWANATPMVIVPADPAE
jgi:hypothetical protein